MPRIPGWYETQRRRYPRVLESYESLGEACRRAGPLDEKTASLVKLAIAVGARLEGAVHSHVRRSVEAGATMEECRHVVLLATTTLGFPSMMAALSWLEDVRAPRRRVSRASSGRARR